MLPRLASAQGIDSDEQSSPIEFKAPRAKFLAGPRLAINRNFHTGGFRTIKESNCPIFSSGSGWGYAGGLTAEYIAGRNWSIIPAISYESRPGSFKQSLPNVQVLLDGEILPVEQTIDAASDITYQIVSAEVLYKQEFLQLGKSIRLSAAAGPAASVVIGGQITQVQDLIEPQNARFRNTSGVYPNERNGRRQVFAKNDEIDQRSSTRFSLKGGLQAEVGLFNNAIIMYPGAFYDYGLTKVTSAENWNLNSLVFQIDFRRAF
jgi:hypothetical protein